MGRRALAGAVVTLLLLVGACGNDDTDGAPGAAPGAGDRESGASGDDPCSLLEVSEIEAAFGDHGPVADGEALGFSCSWVIGDPEEMSSGAVSLTSARSAGTAEAEQAIQEIRDLSTDPVVVEGLGDEAFFDFAFLWFRAGDQVFSVGAIFRSDDPSAPDKQKTLAQHMLTRS